MRIILSILCAVNSAMAFSGEACLTSTEINGKIDYVLSNVGLMKLDGETVDVVDLMDISNKASDYSLEVAADSFICAKRRYGCDYRRISEYYFSLNNIYSKYPDISETDRYVFSRTYDLLVQEGAKCPK